MGQTAAASGVPAPGLPEAAVIVRGDSRRKITTRARKPALCNELIAWNPHRHLSAISDREEHFLSKWSQRPGRPGPALFSPHSTSIAVRDGRAIGRWDSVVKKFRLAGRTDSAADLTKLPRYPMGMEPFEDFGSPSPLCDVALNYLNIRGVIRRRGAAYGGVSCPVARTRLTASCRLAASIWCITRRR